MTEEMTPEWLAEIQGRSDAATPGPWFAVELPPNRHSRHPAFWVETEYTRDREESTVSEVVAEFPWSLADAEFTAHARQDVPALVAEVERLRGERDEFADRVDTLTSVAKGNKEHVKRLYHELQKTQARITELEEQRNSALADSVAETRRLESGIHEALAALMSGDRVDSARILRQLANDEEAQP